MGVVVRRTDLAALFRELHAAGYRVVGPTVRDGAIVHDAIRGPEDLPVGLGDEQDAGRYRLRRRDDGALFGYGPGPHSWKRFLQPPRLELWRAHREGRGFAVGDAPPAAAPRLALLGVRPCDLRAIAILDRVLASGPHPDPDYVARRAALFVVAVNCGQAGGTCFCVSMGTGPRAGPGYDLAVTELGERDELLFEAGSETGGALLESIPGRPAAAGDEEAAARVVARTAASMGRSLDTAGIRDLLFSNLERPRWDEVAKRCLACTNCTMVCPTCFCTTVEDAVDLAGVGATRVRVADSCFTPGHSWIHGGSVHPSIRSRYRQWLTHKLASWIDQFGTSGCVGCGRCITWCPVGIDLTEEVAAIRPAGRRPGAALRRRRADESEAFEEAELAERSGAGRPVADARRAPGAKGDAS